nr:unnamed protein product [Spirometra erinaceieuropaei]
MIDRLHRQVKIALTVTEDRANWSDFLPLAYLGFRAAVRPEMPGSAVELVLGITLRRPDEMVTPKSRVAYQSPGNLCYSLLRSDLIPDKYVCTDPTPCAIATLRLSRVLTLAVEFSANHDNPNRPISVKADLSVAQGGMTTVLLPPPTCSNLFSSLSAQNAISSQPTPNSFSFYSEPGLNVAVTGDCLWLKLPIPACVGL